MQQVNNRAKFNKKGTFFVEKAVSTKQNFKIQGVHKVLQTFKILISQKPHKVETLNF